jgi:signal transduction histidine kinase
VLKKFVIDLESRVKSYFIGDILRGETDHLTRANYIIIYYSCALAVILLIPLQFVYYTKETFDLHQIIIGIASILFFTGGLFALKFKKQYRTVSTVLIGFSVFSFSTGLWLYPDYSMIGGLHLCINLFFSFYVLTRTWAVAYSILQFLSLIAYWYTYSLDITITFLEPVQQPLIERISAVSILIIIIVLIIQHYKNAHQEASKKLAESLEEVKKAKQAAEEMNQLKSRFLANMSHEIRTPLNGILGITEILKDTITDPQHQEFLEIQDRSGYRLLNTIDGILSLSRLEVKSEFFHLTEVDLSSVVDEVIKNQNSIAQARRIDVKYSYLTTNLVVKVDEDIIYQVISNILNNAIKFTANQGLVEVKIEEALSGDIVLSVSDNGIGISPEFISRIFEPFERDIANLSSSQTGTGLGLSITQKFVELMGGKIEVESILGEGTTFHIILPSNKSQPIKTEING